MNFVYTYIFEISCLIYKLDSLNVVFSSTEESEKLPSEKTLPETLNVDK